MKQKFEAEVLRLNKFQKSFLGKEKMIKADIKEIDLKDYAKYVLSEGTIIEKREFLGCIKSKLLLKQKIVKIERI